MYPDYFSCEGNDVTSRMQICQDVVKF